MTENKQRLYDNKYKERNKKIRNTQKEGLKSLGMKKGYRVYSAEELDLNSIYDYESVIQSSKTLLNQDGNFQFIFNADGDAGGEWIQHIQTPAIEPPR
jgi:hypothetical protein